MNGGGGNALPRAGNDGVPFSSVDNEIDVNKDNALCLAVTKTVKNVEDPLPLVDSEISTNNQDPLPLINDDVDVHNEHLPPLINSEPEREDVGFIITHFLIFHVFILIIIRVTTTTIRVMKRLEETGT